MPDGPWRLKLGPEWLENLRFSHGNPELNRFGVLGSLQFLLEHSLDHAFAYTQFALKGR